MVSTSGSRKKPSKSALTLLALPLSALLSGSWVYYRLNETASPDGEFRDAIAHMSAITAPQPHPAVTEAAARAAAEQLAADQARAAAEASAYAAMIVEAHEPEPAPEPAPEPRRAKKKRAPRGQAIRYSVGTRRREPEGNEILETLYLDWSDEERRRTIRKAPASAHEIEVADGELRPTRRSSVVLQTGGSGR